jgi:photosystem II stability/assembly factor-like uncharacterized protein
MKVPLRVILVVLCMIPGINRLHSQWREASGFDGDCINCVAVKGNILIAGTSTGIYRSSDNGATWAAVNSGGSRIVANALAVSDDEIFAGTDDGIFHSTDNGSNWTVMSPGLTGLQIKSLAVRGTNLFAGTYYAGIWVSTNNGEHWSQANAGLGTITNSSINSLAVFGSDIYAWMSGQYGGGDVFRSADNGANWIKTSLPSDYGGPGSIAAIDSNIIVIAGNNIFRTANNGSDWTILDKGLYWNDVRGLAVLGTNLFVGTNVGVFRSTDHGTSWTEASTGLLNKHVNTLTCAGMKLFVGTDGDGISVSTDTGASWSSANIGLSGISSKLVSTLATSGQHLFAGTIGDGIYHSLDSGTNWTAVNTGLLNGYIRSLFCNGTDLIAGTDVGIFRSTDYGAHWVSASNGLTNQRVQALTAVGTYLFAGSDGGVFRSADNGASWESANTGLTNMSIRAFAVSKTKLFAGTAGGGIFQSTNNGASWSEVNTGITGFTNKYVHGVAVAGTNIVAATEGGALYCAENDMHWTAAGPTATSGLYSLVAAGSVLYAGGDGVIRSMDKGVTWEKIGLNDGCSIDGLVSSSTNLFAAGRGVWKISLSDAAVFPSAPEMILPADRAYEVSVNPTFRWKASDGGSSYRFQLCADPNFYSPIIDSAGITSASYDVRGLAKSRTYYWRINAANVLGISEWSHIWKFATIVIVPVAPTLISPIAQYLVTPTNPTLSWTSPPGAVSYHVQLAVDSLFTAPIIDKDGITLTTCQINGLATHTVYYWRVCAAGSDSISAWSRVGTFLTKLADLIPTTPVNGATDVPLSTSLQWEPVVGRGWYHVQLSTDTSFSTKIADNSFFSATLYPVSGLSNNTKYFWRVAAVTVSESGPWCALQTFTTTHSTSVSKNEAMPKEYALANNYPNPFNPSTTISFSLPKGGFVTLIIMDALGRQTAVIVNEELIPGYYSYQWNASEMPSGVYFYRLKAGAYSATKRLLLLK